MPPQTATPAGAPSSAQIPLHARLVYVVGPSGSGKDSVIGYARAALPPESIVRFARRTITRPATAGHEDHASATPQEFDDLLSRGCFAMHWRANGLAYGIGREILGWLADGATVVVSGSREHLPAAMAAFPRIEIVHVTASADVLRQRLASRGREDAAAVESRLARAAAFNLPEGASAVLIRNEGRLEDAGRAFIGCLTRV